MEKKPTFKERAKRMLEVGLELEALADHPGRDDACVHSIEGGKFIIEEPFLIRILFRHISVHFSYRLIL